MSKIYDTIIIGAGPAGMTAAMYTARSEMSTLLLEAGIPGGQMNNTAEIENYPGYASILGPDLAENMFEPLEDLGVEYEYGEVLDIVDKGNFKEVITDDTTYLTKTVIIATGSSTKKLGIPSEDTYASRGVSYCAVCDGAFFKGQEIAVIGGGDSAIEEAIYLTRFGNVTVFHRRDKLRAQKIIQERAFKNDKIKFVWNATPIEIVGDEKKVTSISYKDLKTNEVHSKATSGVFIYVGLYPISGFTKSLGITDDSGWIITDDHMHTSTPGVYAIGDVRQKDLRQITTAVGDGAMAAQEASKFIES